MITPSDRRAAVLLRARLLRVPALGGALILAMGLLAACTTPAERAQSDLDVLSVALPGVYHDVAAAAGGGSAKTRGAATAGHPGSTLTFSIARVRAQLVGELVYFVRESPTDNERLVYAQRIWTLALTPHGELLQRMYSFKDPRRWIGVSEHQELLLSLLPDDLAPLQHCELIWRESATGFEAAPARDDCQPGTAAQGQSVERAATLRHNQLSLTQTAVGTDGSLSSMPGSTTTLLLQRGGGGAGGGGAGPIH